MYEIRKIHSNEVMEALALALEVFLQFEAPDYKPEGIETFKRDIVENDEFISKCQQGICPIYAAFDKGKMIGIIGMYSNRKHINLAFTKKEYHRQGTQAPSGPVLRGEEAVSFHCPFNNPWKTP